jgi:tetratricopeptide (TPR) repeat protein
VKTTGDGLLVEFGSVVDVLRCAVEVQQSMAERNIAVGDRIEFRIGINVGDIVVEDGDIFGDGVNVAARLEALAEPGGICVSCTSPGGLRIWAGEIEAGIERIEAALRLSPRARVGYANAMIGYAYVLGGRFAEAVPKLLLAIQEDTTVLPYRSLAVCYALMGRLDEAREVVARLRKLNAAAAGDTVV